jgi:hypothetical protein
MLVVLAALRMGGGWALRVGWKGPPLDRCGHPTPNAEPRPAYAGVGVERLLAPGSTLTCSVPTFHSWSP